VGGGADATHMASTEDPILNVPVAEMAFPLVHPAAVLVRRDLDWGFLQEVVIPRLTRPSAARRLAARVVPKCLVKAAKTAAAMIAAAPSLLDP